MPELSREGVEYIRDFAQHRGFRTWYATCLKPEIDRWRTRLLTDESLTHDERLGMVKAIKCLKAGIEDAFGKAGLDIPQWILEEFEHERD